MRNIITARLCFNKAGTKVYFTRNNLSPNNGRYNLEICTATLEKGEWGNIKIMPFVEQEYDFYHPALSNDETRLYFCSNKPGGIGGSDIYYANLDTRRYLNQLTHQVAGSTHRAMNCSRR
jgi:hypothetical protein